MFKLSRRTKIKMINYYPPYLGAGIKLEYLSQDFKKAVVGMKLRWWNKNMVGTHFGGSLMSMSDPFYMLLFMQNLGRDYIVWDKATTIRFKRPGTGKVTCVFEIDDDLIHALKTEADESGKAEKVLPLFIKNEADEVVCELEKTVYVRRK